MTSSEIEQIGSAVIEGALVAFQANKGWADKAIAQLPNEKLHVPLDPHTNCIAVIMKHLTGNLRSRWSDFLTSDGEKPGRDRDDEFTDTLLDRAELLDFWNQGWSQVFATLGTLQAADVARSVTIRGERLSVPLAMSRSLAHAGYHVGQIILIARILAQDNWTTITIPRGGSAQYNQAMWGQESYQALGTPPAGP